MKFESAISRVPLAFEGSAAEVLPDSEKVRNPHFGELTGNAATCSPFLRGLMSGDQDWLVQLAYSDPQDSLSELCADIPLEDHRSVVKELRIRKKRIALLCGLADLGGVWQLEEVTGALTRFADFASHSLLVSLTWDALRRRRISDLNSKIGTSEICLFALAMGKMGAGELNYSSDIDLIVLFDEESFDKVNFHFAKAEFIKITRRFAKLMTEVTSDGYVFRTDLRLRPDPLVNPVCMSAGGASRYYESFARTWERAAFIKARPCAGDKAAGHRFLDSIKDFIWRRTLDFAAVEDANDIRNRIQKSKGTGDSNSIRGHNLKLGDGGIRQIELFVQTIQMIAGGRDRMLRVPNTLGALNALSTQGWVQADARDALSECYRFLRELEHRVQMVRDTQTHLFPKSDSEIRRIAALCCTDDLDQFCTDVRSTLESVSRLTTSVYSQPSSEMNELHDSFLTEQDRELMERWQTLPTLRTERASKIFSRLQPLILSRVGRASNPREALAQFDAFLKGLPAAVQLFSLFEANPQLIELLADACATAPRLAQYLARNSQVFDAVLDGHFFEAMPDIGKLKTELHAELAAVEGYELELRTARRWLSEQHFRLGIHVLKEFADPLHASQIYADFAEAIIASIWPLVVREFSARHGPQPGKGAAIIAMGSLGAQQLTAQSDLDLIVIYDPLDQEYSIGDRPLPTRQYYARLTQALVSALSSQMREGSLYSIDMRLRPSGRQGPVATSFKSFCDYQLNSAWTWEHLALTRARHVTGCQSLGAEIEKFRCRLMKRDRNTATVIEDVVAMRERLQKHTSSAVELDKWEFKLGKGRILDIEMTAEAGALLSASCDRSVAGQLREGVSGGWISPKGARVLRRSYRTLRLVQQITRLTVQGRFQPELAGAGVRELLLRATQEDSMENLTSRLEEERKACAKAIEEVLSLNESRADHV